MTFVISTGAIKITSKLKEIMIDIIDYPEIIFLFSSFRSMISIFFKNDDFIYTKRSELYGLTDFIANFGGLLGLFLGVSILSIVEIIYFISFRQLNEESRDPSLSEHDSTRSAESL
jgi:Amiloride-sensitive sodium channel